MSKRKKIDISTLFDNSVEVSNKFVENLNRKNKSKKGKKKCKKKCKKNYTSNEFKELQNYILSLYYSNRLYQDMLIWIIASMIERKSKDCISENYNIQFLEEEEHE